VAGNAEDVAGNAEDVAGNAEDVAGARTNSKAEVARSRKSEVGGGKWEVLDR